MKSEIGQQLRSRRITTSTDQSLEEDSMDSALKISPNLTPEFDHHHQEFEGKISDGGIDEKKTTTTTSVSTLPCLVAQDETAAKISSLGQLDATADDDDNDGFKTPTDLAHRIPTPTECPPAPAPKIKKRPYDYSPVNSAAVRSRSCRRKLVFDGFDLMARLKIQEDEDLGIHLCSLNN